MTSLEGAPRRKGWLGLTLQLPVQAQSSLFVAEWERTAGAAEIISVAKAADESGWFAVAACEHIGIPESRAAAMGTHWTDPVATLALVAGHTRNVRLMTYVYILAARHPLLAAKSLMSLDHLSGGRLIAGVGAGHVEEEFAALGLDFAHRGTSLSHSIRALRQCFEAEFVQLEAPFGSEDLSPIGLSPRPNQVGGPPVFVAGSSDAAIKRAARFGDGWLPQGPATQAMVDRVVELRAEVRPDSPLTIGHIAGLVHLTDHLSSYEVPPYVLVGSSDQVAERIRSQMPRGVHVMQVLVWARSCDEFCDQVRRIGTELAPLLQ